MSFISPVDPLTDLILLNEEIEAQKLLADQEYGSKSFDDYTCCKSTAETDKLMQLLEQREMLESRIKNRKRKSK